MKLLLGLLFVAACGSVDDNTHPPDAPHQDSSLPADAEVVVDAPPARCDPSKPFDPPVQITAFSSNFDEIQASVSADQATALFASNRSGGAGGYDIYTSTRATKTAAWGTPTLLAGVNTAFGESHPSMSGDGKTLYVSAQDANGAYTIKYATRANTTSAFSALQPVTVLNASGNAYDPYVLPDQSAIYFSSTRNGNDMADIYVATGTAGSFIAPTPVTGTMLQTTLNDEAATLTPDQLTMYFRSDRGGQFDVWLATRTSLANGFGAPANVTVVNTSGVEFPSWISADGCIMYFTRATGVGSPNYEIFSVTKPL